MTRVYHKPEFSVSFDEMSGSLIITDRSFIGDIERWSLTLQAGVVIKTTATDDRFTISILIRGKSGLADENIYSFWDKSYRFAWMGFLRHLHMSMQKGQPYSGINIRYSKEMSR